MSSRIPSIEKKERVWPGYVPWGLAGLSGGLLFLVFPKFNLYVLAWVALVPLLRAVESARRARTAFMLGLVAGTVQFVGVLSWIQHPLIHYGHVSFGLALGICGLLAVFLSLFVGLFGLLLHWAYRYGGRRALALAPFAWVTSELARNYLAINGFPWCLLGYSQVPQLALMQMADITGIYGISFLIGLVNAAVAEWLRAKPANGSRRRNALGLTTAAIILMALSLVYAMRRAQSIRATENGKPVPVACIQGNIPITDHMDPYREAFYRTYPRMIRSAMESHRPEMIPSPASAPNAGPVEPIKSSFSGLEAFAEKAGMRPVVILPESPTPFYFQTDVAFRRHMISLAQQNNTWLLFNNTSYDYIETQGAYFNSVYLLSPAGDLVSRYDKNHLVPFGEYVPLKSVLRFAGKVLQEVSDFAPGRDRVISDVSGARFGVFICFEALFPEMVRQFPKHGAEFLINITNDAWYGDTAAPYQHLNMVVVRAIENRRYLVRATNSGISAIIDPYGRCSSVTGLFREAILTGVVISRHDLTFYTRFGDVFAWICVIIAVGSPLYGYFKGGKITL